MEYPMPNKHHVPKQLTFMHSSTDVSPYAYNSKIVATNGTMTYILTSSAIEPRNILELEGLLPSSAYTLQLLLKDNSEPLLLVGEQHPDKSLKKHHVWDFFGGKTHPEEDAREAALRERIEETGITKEIAPYIDPVIYVVFDDHGERCAKAFFFSTLSYDLLGEPDFLPRCKHEIIKIADGRFEIIALAALKISDFFEQISPNNDKAHEAHLRSMRLILQDHSQDGLHSRNTWRKHVPLLLGNAVVQDMILQVVQDFVPHVKSTAKAALKV
jgi:8-oxo-dGTP pyrophosphatase MutT (NUDIX family)